MYYYISYIKTLSKALPLVVSPLKLVNFGLLSLNKNLKIAKSQKTIDGFLFQGPFCVYMGVVYQKNELPTLFNYVRVRESHQPHVVDILEIQTKPGWCLESLTLGAVSFYSQFYLPLKTMGANARGSGSYKNMSVQFASKPNFLKTKFDCFHR